MLEISITKDLSLRLNINIEKTKNIEPDIDHWYAKILIFNRKKYVFAINTLTRFAIFFKLNSKTFIKDFKSTLADELDRYNMDFSKIMNKDVFISGTNNKKNYWAIKFCC